MQRNTILKSKNFYPDIFPFYDVNKTRIPLKETCETHFLDASPNFEGSKEPKLKVCFVFAASEHCNKPKAYLGANATQPRQRETLMRREPF